MRPSLTFFPFPLKPLAFCLCAGLAGYAHAAPLAPFAVDPVLLGLPPLKPRPVALPAAAGPAEAPAGPGVEVRPVAPPGVEPLSGAEPSSAGGRRQTARAMASPAGKGSDGAAAAALADSGVEAEAPALDPGPPLRLATTRRMGQLPEPPAGEGLPTFLLADRLSGITDVTTVAEGNAELRRLHQTMTADRMTFRHVEDEIEAEGNVVLTDPTGSISGPFMRQQVDARTGFFTTPSYAFKQEKVIRDNNPYAISMPGVPATSEIRHTTVLSGQADRILFEGDQKYRLENATFSTCQGPDPDWYGRVSDLNLDYETERAEGGSAVMYFKDVPFMYTPMMSFGLNTQRKSGLLAPTFSSSTKSGFDFSLPYYVNLAPNYDLVLTPRYLSKRGAMLGGDFRYLTPSASGEIQGEYLTNDNLYGSSRYSYNVSHFQDFGYGLTGRLDLQGVSDNTYFTDLTTRLTQISQNQLMRRGQLNYAGSWWNASALVQRYQTLQPDPTAPVAKPYSLEPQINVSGRLPDLYKTDFAFNASYSDFRHPDLDEGKRLYAYPTLSLPMETAGLFFTPKVGLNMATYSLNRRVSTGENTVSRAIPVVSMDAGAVFERDMSLAGSSFVQTLEPRLFYVYIPYQNQDNVPLFDTSASDLNFAQIFTENRYNGADRVGDANQLTAALSSRFIRSETGAEVIKAMVGQRFYFADQKVGLTPGTPPSTSRLADWLVAVNGQVAPYTTLDLGWQYNPRDSRTERFTTALRYRPESGKMLQFAYRQSRDLVPPFNTAIRQFDLAGQWPLGGRLYGVGRYNYSTLDKRLLEGVAGLEYQGDCWVFRGVIQQVAVTSATPTRAFFLQLELSDFGAIGSNPLMILRRNIPGYSRTLPADSSVPVSPYEDAL